MSNRCSVCSSDLHAEIDRALLVGASARGTAIRLGFGIRAMQNHAQRDLARNQAPERPTPVRNTVKTGGIAELVTLLEHEVASSTGRARLDASREYRLALAELAKTGSQDAGPDAWPALRQILVDATAGYPDVRAAIVAAIKVYEASK